mmetsp:Transcript_42718/g.105284  ORF Transcript_42718/g.105284 Transcript_42718/m.105284 type:complete len:342 (+) Transcript_42718:3384-4409(+)
MRVGLEAGPAHAAGDAEVQQHRRHHHQPRRAREVVAPVAERAGHEALEPSLRSHAWQRPLVPPVVRPLVARPPAARQPCVRQGGLEGVHGGFRLGEARGRRLAGRAGWWVEQARQRRWRRARVHARRALGEPRGRARPGHSLRCAHAARKRPRGRREEAARHLGRRRACDCEQLLPALRRRALHRRRRWAGRRVLAHCSEQVAQAPGGGEGLAHANGLSQVASGGRVGDGQKLRSRRKLPHWGRAPRGERRGERCFDRRCQRRECRRAMRARGVPDRQLVERHLAWAGTPHRQARPDASGAQRRLDCARDLHHRSVLGGPSSTSPVPRASQIPRLKSSAPG